MEPSPEPARCALHPDQAATATCARCGSFVCAGCAVPRDAQAYCRPCDVRQPAPVRPSPRATAALILGILGLNCLGVPGIVGLVLSYKELAAIRRGESTSASESAANAGRILGWISVAIVLIGGAAGAYALLERD